MDKDTLQEAAKAAIRYLLPIVIVICLISGLGITQYQIIESLTFGFLTRNLAFKIHDFLLAPFVVLLTAHVLIGPLMRAFSHFQEGQRGA